MKTAGQGKFPAQTVDKVPIGSAKTLSMGTLLW